MDSVVSILTAHPSIKYGAVVLAYMGLVRFLRYRRINGLLKKYPDPTIPLRNLEVAKEISAAVSEFEFPYVNVVSLEFALFKTYAVPTISKILAATKEFSGSCLKRADDTTLILLEINESYSRNMRRVMTEGKVDEKEMLNDTKREDIAMEKMNFLHGQYNIRQEDFLFTLALFVLEPDRFIRDYEWRPLTELERNALMAVWSDNGKRMGIKNIPETKEEFEVWADAFENSEFKYAKTNRVIADVTVDLLLSLAPSFTHNFGRMAASSMMTPLLRQAMDMPPPPMGVTTLVYGALRARALFIRYFMLPRRLPLVRTASRANQEGKYVPQYNKYEAVYPDGYKVEDLGPQKFVGKCPFSFDVSAPAVCPAKEA